MVCASDGHQALKLVDELGPPWLVLLDLMMPEKDGWQVLWELRQRPDTAKVPVIVMSGLPDANQALNGAEVSGFLAKPFEMDELLRAMRDALSPRQLRARARLPW